MISQHYITVTPIFMPSERDRLNVSFTYGAIFIDRAEKRVHSAKIFPIFHTFSILFTAYFYLLIELLWNFYDFSLSVQSAQIQQYQSHSNVSTSQYFFIFFIINSLTPIMCENIWRRRRLGILIGIFLTINPRFSIEYMIIDWLSCSSRYR